MIFKISFYIFLLQLVRWSTCDDICVESNVGTIKGLLSDNGEYNMFMGIPYAAVNESNPFGVALAYPSFTEAFEAYDDSTMCPQVNQINSTITGSLDCLRLNVYVPTSGNVSNLPVMFWVFGGRFQSGCGSRDLYGPDYLVHHDVIVVTMNYRLGPYGFMCLDIPEVPGNQGLKDQYLALQWVKNNIEAFGGDPNQITIFGESAGGHSIDLHLMSTRDILFNKMILQTGSALSLTVLYDADKSAPLTLASYMGFETEDIREALSFLATSNTTEVIDASIKLGIQFKPCVENSYDNVEPFISAAWINTLVPKVKDIPILMGFNRHEMASKFQSKDFTNSTEISDNLMQIFDFTDEELNKMKTYVSHKYFGDATGADTKWGMIRYATDFTYIHPVHRTLKRYLENGAGNIYCYMLSYVGGRNLYVTDTYDEDNGKCCVSHADDLPYVFTMPLRPDPTEADLVIINRMTAMWTNFAKYSNPTPETTDILPVTWLPVTSEVYNYLDIDTDLTMGKRPYFERMAFWDLFYEHNSKLQKGYVEL
ncbi:cholinesterase-like [Anticarsia gemmatalis]|uniref:cholinesterase-like n=1 Tax=Anticarsia gemmatalis TaxID=129554 RepID=UPI003F76E9E1